MKLFYKTNRYQKYSITVIAVKSLSKMKKTKQKKKQKNKLKNMLLKDLSPNKVKTVVTNFYLKSYQ